jgi:site-specific recombinase XerC
MPSRTNTLGHETSLHAHDVTSNEARAITGEVNRRSLNFFKLAKSPHWERAMVLSLRTRPVNQRSVHRRFKESWGNSVHCYVIPHPLRHEAARKHCHRTFAGAVRGELMQAK